LRQGLPQCSHKAPCALHQGWAKEQKRLYNMFGRLTLAQVAQSPGLQAKTS
jgi:hypothetical protein